MRFVPQLPGQFSEKSHRNSAKEAFMKNMKRGNKKGAQDAPPEDRYQELLNAKLEETRNEAMKGSKYTFNLAGTDGTGCRELSKSAQEMIQKIAEKKAKQAQKKASKTDLVAIQAKYFTGMQGGRIDKGGKIYDSKGQVVMEVDKKTGKVKNAKTGTVVAKYDPKSPYSEHRICEMIAKLSSQQGGTASLWGNTGAPQGGQGVWGSGGSIWGSSDSNSGGSVWGSSDSDNKSGWW